MTLLVLIFLCVVAAVTVYGVIFLPDATWRRLFGLGVLIGLYGIVWVSISELLSRPKPVSLEYARGATEEAGVLGSHIVIDKAIYLWLALPGIDEPRAYVLPWSAEMAKELAKARKDAEQAMGLAMRLPFQKSWNTDKKFYPIPVPMLPPKAGTPPVEYKRQEM